MRNAVPRRRPRSGRARLSTVLVLVMAALLAAVPVAGATTTEGPPVPPEEDLAGGTASIADLAGQVPQLSTLVAAVEKAGLTEVLDTQGPFTVFAPDNDAFVAAGVDVEAADPETLRAVLLDHVLPGRLLSPALRLTALRAEVLEPLGELDLVVGRDPLTVNLQAVSIPNVPASNGVVHVIEGVLTETPSIGDIAAATPDLSTLAAAADKAGLLAVLDPPTETTTSDTDPEKVTADPLTVFAPTNAAFRAAGVDVEAVETATVEAVLLDHVVPGLVTAGDVVRLILTQETVTSVGGLELRFSLLPGVQVNDVRIQTVNVRAGNGVIHTIEGVLLEPAEE